MPQVRIQLGSLLQWADIRSKDEAIAAWACMETFLKGYVYVWNDPFREQAPTDLSVTIDASCVKSFLGTLRDDEESKVRFMEMLERQSSGETVLYLDVEFTHAHSSPRPDIGLGLLLQDLFLSLNIAVPGSCCFYGTALESPAHDIDVLPTPSADRFHAARLLRDEWQWPLLGTVTSVQVWDWLELIGFRATYIADTPTQRAVMALLDCSSKQGDLKPSTLVELTQALEGFFIGDRHGLAALFRDRIHAVLGAPATHTKWATQVYDLRSRIAHGSFPTIRPIFHDDICERHGGIIKELLNAEDRAFLVLLATIQDLILTQSETYAFTSSFIRRKAKKG